MTVNSFWQEQLLKHKLGTQPVLSCLALRGCQLAPVLSSTSRTVTEGCSWCLYLRLCVFANQARAHQTQGGLSNLTIALIQSGYCIKPHMPRNFSSPPISGFVSAGIRPQGPWHVDVKNTVPYLMFPLSRTRCSSVLTGTPVVVVPISLLCLI